MPELIKYARRLVPRPDWRFETVNSLTIPEKDGQADIVCFFSVFTHLLHEQQGRPGGVSLSDPRSEKLQSPVRLLMMTARKSAHSHQSQGGSVGVIRMIEFNTNVIKPEMLDARQEVLPAQPVREARRSSAEALPSERFTVVIPLKRVPKALVFGGVAVCRRAGYRPPNSHVCTTADMDQHDCTAQAIFSAAATNWEPSA